MPDLSAPLHFERRKSVICPNLGKSASKSICCFIICMNIDYNIPPLHDHPMVCDWTKIVSKLYKIGRKFAAFCGSHCSKFARCGIMQMSPPPQFQVLHHSRCLIMNHILGGQIRVIHRSRSQILGISQNIAGSSKNTICPETSPTSRIVPKIMCRIAMTVTTTCSCSNLFKFVARYVSLLEIQT